MLLDNSSEKRQLINALKENLKNSSQSKFAVGYFFLSGFNLVKEDFPFDKNHQLKIVMGRETTKPTAEEISLGYKLRKNTIENEFFNQLNIVEKDEIKRIKELRDLIKEGKIDIKIYNEDRMHAKLYLFIKKPELIQQWKQTQAIYESPGVAIIGSANFTEKGLTTNKELNLLITDVRAICELNEWFDKLWDSSLPFSEKLLKIIDLSEVLHELEGKKRINWGIYVTPEELFKILSYEILNGRIELTREKRILVLFQDIGVINAIDKIQKYYGVLIADSVGLGKSFIGAQILKDFLYGKLDFWDGKLKKKWESIGKGVLLIVPAHLKSQWKEDVLLKHFFSNCIMKSIDGEFVFDLIDKEFGRLGRVRIESYSKFSRMGEEELRRLSDEYDIVLIDEAHRFRDKNTRAWNNIQVLKKKTTYKSEIGRGIPESIRNRFILLTATPLNNSIEDLKNLLKVFLDRDFRDLERQGKNTSLFDIYSSLKEELKKNPSNPEIIKKFKQVVTQIKKEILDDLILLRTRKYIREKYTGVTINNKPLVFKDSTIKKIRYDEKLGEYYRDYLDLYVGLSDFLRDLELPYVEFFTEDDRKTNIKGLMKILLLKRMESSIYAFERSIQNIKMKEEFLLELLHKHKDINTIREQWLKKFKSSTQKEFEESDTLGDFLEEKFEGFSEADLEKLKEKTKRDIELIERYQKKIERVKLNSDKDEYKDPKLERLFEELDHLISNGGAKPKILIFTQFKDTAYYIHKKVNEWLERQDNPALRNYNVGIVTGDTDTETKAIIIKRFAPVANDYTPKEGEEIHLLISTDALSEGVNLQDASIIMNYDLPWNPMRIVQREGRVNRIGNENRIFVCNFFPDRDLEELLKLLETLFDKIEDVKNLLAKETQILTEEEDITIDTIGEVIKKVREEVDLAKLEEISRNKEFELAEVYGEDVESLQKLTLISRLMELGTREEDFIELRDKIGRNPFYTILEKDEVLRLYQIYDKVRSEKMKNILVAYDGTKLKEVGVEKLIELSRTRSTKTLLDLDEKSIKTLRKKIMEMDKRFESEFLKPYKLLFTPQRQVRLASLSGIQRKIVRYLKKLRSYGSFYADQEKLDQIIQIYESLKLRSQEVKALKETFFELGVDIEKADLRKVNIEILLEGLERFYTDYLARRPDTYFGGIRLDKDLDYKVIGWYA